MHIHLHGPLEKIAQKEIQINVKRAITLRRLLELLAQQYPAIAPYASCKTDIDLSAHLMAYKGGRILKINDTVENYEKIQLVIHVMGG